MDQFPKVKHVTVMTRCIKTAKNFEKLRALKKIKTLKAELEPSEENPEADNKVTEEDKNSIEQKIKDLELENQLIKDIDQALFAKKLLSRMINKSKPLKEHGRVAAFLKETQDLEVLNQNKVEGVVFSKVILEKAINRLASNKTISESLEKVKSELMVDLGIVETNAKPKAKKGNDKAGIEQSNKKGSKETKADKSDSQAEASSKDETKSSKRKRASSPTQPLYVDNLQDYDEDDAEFKEMYGIKPKNRMGQRQRRMLLEEKLGDKARHIQAEKEAQLQEAKYQAKKAKSKGKGGPKANSDGKNRSKDSEASESISKPKGKGKNKEKLHPSWLAKKQQKIAIISAVPQGKKITFDE